MLIAAHVFIALVSILYTTYLFFAPNQDRLKVAQALVVLTLASGTYLAVTMPAHLLQSCMMGLLYIAGVSVGLVMAGRKLADQPQI